MTNVYVCCQATSCGAGNNNDGSPEVLKAEGVWHTLHWCKKNLVVDKWVYLPLCRRLGVNCGLSVKQSFGFNSNHKGFPNPNHDHCTSLTLIRQVLVGDIVHLIVTNPRSENAHIVRVVLGTVIRFVWKTPTNNCTMCRLSYLDLHRLFKVRALSFSTRE